MSWPSKLQASVSTSLLHRVAWAASIFGSQRPWPWDTSPKRGKASCSARAKFSHQLDWKCNFSVKTASVVLGWCGVQLLCPWSLSAAGRQSSVVHPTCSGINHPHPPEHLSSVNLSSDSQEHTEARSFDKGALDSGTRDVSQSSRVQISCQRSPLEDFPERIGL